MVIPSQFIQISNQYVKHLKHTMLVIMLYIPSTTHLYYNWSLCFLTLHRSLVRPPSPLATMICSFVCKEPAYKWDLTAFLCWPTSLSIMPLKSIHIIAIEISFFLWLNIMLYIYVSHFLYPFIHRWTLCFHIMAFVNNAAVNVERANIFFELVGFF